MVILNLDGDFIIESGNQSIQNTDGFFKLSDLISKLQEFKENTGDDCRITAFRLKLKCKDSYGIEHGIDSKIRKKKRVST